MATSDWTAIVSAVVAVLGLLLAARQALTSARTRRSADVAIAEQRAQLESALHAVRRLATQADALVQQAKQPPHPQDLVERARLLRSELLDLQSVLSKQLGTRGRWSAGVYVSSPE